MKKQLLILLALCSITTCAVSGQTRPWIKTSDGQINCKKISVYKDEVKVILENGEKKNLTINDVDSYFRDGSLFIKVPLFNKGGKDKTVFMESLANKDDQQLYRYLDSPGYSRYFVYKGENLVIEVTDANKEAFSKYFNISI